MVPACIGARRCRGVYAEWNSEARRTPLTISTIVVKLRSDSSIMRVRRVQHRRRPRLSKKIGSGWREEIDDLTRLHNLKAVDDLSGNRIAVSRLAFFRVFHCTMLTRFLNAVIFLALRSQNCLPVESMTAHMVVRQSPRNGSLTLGRIPSYDLVKRSKVK